MTSRLIGKQIDPLAQDKDLRVCLNQSSHIGRETSLIDSESRAYPQQRQPDISRARELGWEPHVAFDEGLERTCAYSRELLAMRKTAQALLLALTSASTAINAKQQNETEIR